MAYQIVPMMPLLVVIILMMAALTGYGLLRYHRHGHRSELLAFVTLVASFGVWGLVSIFILAVESENLKLLGFNVVNGVIVWFGTYSMLWFALTYSGHDRWVNRWTVGLAVSHISVSAIAVVVAPEFLYEVNGLTTQGPVTVLGVTFRKWVVLDRTIKPGFRAYQLYGYTVILAAAVVLGRYMVRNRSDLYTGQAVALAVGIGTPVLSNMLLFVKVLPPEQNVTTLSFAVTGVAFGVAIFRYRLLRLTPVGRQQVVETIEDPVVVFDDEARVVDSNPAARELVDADPGWEGVHAEEFFAPFPEQLERFRGVASADTEISVERNGQTRYFDLELSPIESQYLTKFGTDNRNRDRKRTSLEAQ